MTSRKHLWDFTVGFTILALASAKVAHGDEHRDFQMSEERSETSESTVQSGSILRLGGSRGAVSRTTSTPSRSLASVAPKSTGQRGAYNAPDVRGFKGRGADRPEDNSGPTRKPVVSQKVVNPDYAKFVADTRKTAWEAPPLVLSNPKSPNTTASSWWTSIANFFGTAGSMLRAEGQIQTVRTATEALSEAKLEGKTTTSKDLAGVKREKTEYEPSQLDAINKQVRVIVDQKLDPATGNKLIAEAMGDNAAARDYALSVYKSHTSDFLKVAAEATDAKATELQRTAAQSALSERQREFNEVGSRISGQFTGNGFSVQATSAAKDTKTYETEMAKYLARSMSANDADQEAAILKDLTSRRTNKTATQAELAMLTAMESQTYKDERKGMGARATAWNESRRAGFDANGEPKEATYGTLLKGVSAGSLTDYTAKRLQTGKPEDKTAAQQMLALAASKPGKPGEDRYLVFEKKDDKGNLITVTKKYDPKDPTKAFEEATKAGYALKLPRDEKPPTEKGKASTFEENKTFLAAIEARQKAETESKEAQQALEKAQKELSEFKAPDGSADPNPSPEGQPNIDAMKALRDEAQARVTKAAETVAKLETPQP